MLINVSEENGMNDVEGINRFVVGYYKTLNEYGGYGMAVKFKLSPISLSTLQSLFNVDPRHEDLGARHMIACYPLNKTQAEVLQKYVKEPIELEKYDFMLECESST
jgi:hypothetical protein